ncbi:MAG: T9SS type A sorting domain-containing protein [Candidatus Cloacimonetes bacterium]|jgi:hypothetical protein|nr:T9SS type A sorting domain-containing protein [Candidatus Cloacimonadota bacterium]MCB5288213.1 T9SS type A sorting domain-containing protein [Candidatus Cloacimonadota bacterium]MCK9184845.1 T9SS type A sorting domain-containing protein [Candidatus Cloacimonadota bacterium]MCK9584004.1 T9SS type A sorting domain-containing protein [Candidatus Cloacimonadota bacterium]MDY0230541.1 FlgD immunoglobulin-like domain containing protein [Candidatus Cloacimonadaceae bacterium]
MKHLFLILICLGSVCAFALPQVTAEPDRVLNFQNHDNGSISIANTNYGYQTDMHYTHTQKLIYCSASWISGKKHRRDEMGSLLYWLTFPPSSNSLMVTAQDPLWTPDLVMVQDSLTTAGFDGDLDIYELLPAYNPHLMGNPSVTALYNTYNHQDRVLQSIMGSPAPLLFDPLGSTNFCFSIPQAGNFETPGFLTDSAYYYDYCPFGTEGDRDYGSSSSRSTHYPLGLAVHQESYSWNLQNHDKMLINKYTVYNTSELDAIEDLAISHFVDADLGPSSMGAEIAADDVSGYVKGQGYEFAYSRDFDGDGGLSPHYIASKLIIPVFNDRAKRHAWFWKVGDGPDDNNVRDLQSYNPCTSNEKYWLATGRNADNSKYSPLRPEDPNIVEYEQPSPNDTRFLNTLFGALAGYPGYDETDDQGNYINRINLEPQESITYYTVLFVGDSLDELKARSLQIEAFLADDLQIDPNADLTCIPYLAPIQIQEPDTFDLTWYSYTNPDHFELAYKEYDAPAATWNVTNLAGDIRTHSLTGLAPDTWYEIKIGSVYYTPDEVYLESVTKLANLSHISIGDALVAPVPQMRNYPNPFRTSTNIEYVLKQPARLSLEIYNLRGQKVRSLDDGIYAAGLHNLSWDGKDDGGKTCASGVYYLRLKAGDKHSQHKMLLIK